MSPHWAAAQVYPQRERIALYALDLVGYQTYSPRIAERRIIRGRKTDVLLPLFPGYCFVRIVDHFWTASHAPGIVRLVMDGARPDRDTISISLMKTMTGFANVIRLANDTESGDPVADVGCLQTAGVAAASVPACSGVWTQNWCAIFVSRRRVAAVISA